MLDKSKKAMLANLISGFVVILVAVSLIGPIAQEVNNFATCANGNANVSSFIDVGSSTEQPKGSTDSFGGGGSNHFGGYDNTVKHNAFLDAVASTSMVKTDKSLLNPDCTPVTGASASLLQLVPAFFGISVLLVAFGIIYSSLCSAGILGTEVEISPSTKKKKGKKSK
jgi:hypothetical protein